MKKQFIIYTLALILCMAAVVTITLFSAPSPMFILLLFILLILAVRMLKLHKEPIFKKAVVITTIVTLIIWMAWAVRMLLTINDPADCGSPASPDGLCMSFTTISGSLTWATLGALFTAVPLWMALLCGSIILILLKKLARIGK